MGIKSYKKVVQFLFSLFFYVVRDLRSGGVGKREEPRTIYLTTSGVPFRGTDIKDVTC